MICHGRHQVLGTCFQRLQARAGEKTKTDLGVGLMGVVVMTQLWENLRQGSAYAVNFWCVGRWYVYILCIAQSLGAFLLGLEG